MGYPFVSTLLSLDTVSHHNYDIRVAAHFANPERFHLGFSQRFFCFKASSWWNTIPSPLTRDKYFPAFCKDYTHYLLAHVYVYVFCSGFDCIIILKFCLYCVLSCFVCMYYYVSMVLFCVCGRMYIALVWKNGICRAPKLKLLINQSINQSIGINSVGDCSERTVLGFRSSLLGNNNNNYTTKY